MSLPHLGYVLRLIFKSIVYGFLLLLIAGSGLLYWGLGTDSGFRWLLAQAPQWLPGELHIAEVKGNLLRGSRLRGLRYQQDALRADIGALDLRWNPAALARRELRIQQLGLRDATLHLPPSSPTATETEPLSLGDLSLPLRVVVEQAEIDNVHLHPAQGEPVHVQQVRLQAEAERDLHIQQLSAAVAVAQGEFSVASQGRAGLQAPYPLELDLNWQAQLKPGVATPHALQASGRAKLSGDSAKLQVEHALAQPVSVQLSAVALDWLSTPRWQGEISAPRLAWPLDAAAPLLRQARIKAEGDLRGAELQQLSGEAFDGSFQISGRAQWTDALQAELELHSQGMNLQPLWADWPQQAGLQTRLRARFVEQQLHLQQLEVGLPPLASALSGQGRVDLRGAQPTLDLRLNWRQVQWPLQGAAQITSPQGEVQLTGSPEAYQVQLRAGLSGADLPPSQWTAQVQGDQNQARLQTLRGELLDGTLTVSGAVAWQPLLRAQAQIRAAQLNPRPLWAEWPQGLHLAAEGEINLDDKQLHLPQWRIFLPETEAALTLQAEAELSDKLPFQADIDWQGLHWPLLSGEQVVSEQGRLHAQGDLQQVQASLQAALRGEHIPRSDWQIELRGSPQQVHLDKLQGRLLNGSLEAQGRVDLQPAPAWDMQVSGAGLDPARQWKDWPGTLGLQVHSSGRLDAKQGLQAQVDVKRLDGTLRGYPLSLRARASAAGERYQLQQLELQSGSARLRAEADYGAQLRADFSLHTDHLGELLPKAGGQLHAEGQLSGDLAQPALNLRAEAEQLRLDGLHLAGLKADIAAALPLERPLRLDVEARELRQDGKPLLHRARLSGDGRLARHQLNLEAELPDLSAALQLQGGLDNGLKAWRGALEKLNLTLEKPLQGRWALQDAAPLQLAAEAAQLEQACLQAQDAFPQERACVSAQWQPQGSRLRLGLEKLALARLQAWLPETLNLSGHAEAQVDAALAQDGGLKVEADAAVRPQLTYQGLADEKARSFALHGLDLKLNIDPQQGLDARVDLLTRADDGVRVALQLPDLRGVPLAKTQRLSGRLQGKFSDRQLVEQLVPEISDFQGEALLDASLGGTLAAPQLDGGLRTRDMSLKLPLLGLHLRDMALALQGQSQGEKNTLKLSGQVQSGEGRLELSGQGELGADETWQGEVRLDGERFQVLNSVLGKAWIGSALRLALQPQGLFLSGELRVPEAHLTPLLDSGSGGSGAIHPSADVEIIEPDGAPAEPPRKPLPLHGQVHIFVDKNNTSIDAADFSARLGGDLQLRFSPDKALPDATGLLTIDDGVFNAYGQQLRTEYGRINFSGREVSKPDIDIKAVREILTDPAVDKVGAYISGNPARIRIRFFAEPDRPESEIISYLLLGGNAFGEGQKRMSLGMYVLPKLYVSYGFSVLDRNRSGGAGQVINARYSLSKHWGIEAEAGAQDKGLDLSYEIER